MRNDLADSLLSPPQAMVVERNEVEHVPKGYVIVTEAIHDPEGMNAYGQAAMPSIVEHRAKVLAVDEQVEVLEGEWHGNRTVVLEFESVEAAHQWYTSDTYQAARPLRHAAADSNAVIISGFDLPAG